MPPVELGEVMRAGSYAEVVESKFEGLKPGDKVFAMGGVQDYAVAPGETLSKMDPDIKPEDAMSAFSVIIGLTAYHGMMKICQPKVPLLLPPHPRFNIHTSEFDPFQLRRPPNNPPSAAEGR